jgi:mycofactocin glycosyltransferase
LPLRWRAVMKGDWGMREELLPDRLKRLWKSVDDGLLTSGEFFRDQELYLEEYRRIWRRALLLEGYDDLQESIVFEISSYLGNPDLDAIREACSEAVARIKGEWREKVASVDAQTVETFYDESQAMLFELMWWHTLAEDLSPLAYVVALKFAQHHGCSSYLDFGSGVGSGAILFVRHEIPATLADISSTSLKFSAWRFSRRNLCAGHIDLKVEGLPDDAFDFITAMDVFEHLVDPVKTVADLSKALKKGGFLFGRFAAEADEERPHHINLDFGPTLRALEDAGFAKVWQDQWLWGHEVFRKEG